ncbi:MAG: bifunctional phosphoribosylaminoimidazolecarboxamide formyltransferase/IMP cyclohydrolase [Bdellovibrionales bacterium]
MFKRALVSVSDKAGLIDFLKPLVDRGLEIVSTGGTKDYLLSQGWRVTDISEVTQFPEVLDGRVKTLHPFVHMGLLARQDLETHQKTLREWKVKAFDLVVGNLYPFEKALIDNFQGLDLIEKIDIGGPSFLRSAAKNFSSLAVVCDPADYNWIKEKKYQLNIDDKKRLAARVFRLTSCYDQMIAQTLDAEISESFPFAGQLKQKLRYGENEHQKAWWFSEMGPLTGLSQMEQLQGKELSYNNLLDLDSALNLCSQFSNPTAVAVKHNNPCGVGSADDGLTALTKALSADPVSVFGGIVAANFIIDEAEAKLITSGFIECLLATDFTPAALIQLSQKKNLRVLKADQSLKQSKPKKYIRSVTGGFVLQELDQKFSTPDTWKIIGERPQADIANNLQFGERVCAALKSNAIAIVSGQQTLGLGMGQVNRVEAVQHAIDRWKKHHSQVVDVALISDAFFPFPDSIEICARYGIRWVLQPGGSIKDNEVINKAEELKINMVLTGLRHFRH